MKVREIAAVLDLIAPSRLSEEVGLKLGSVEAEIRRVAVGLRPSTSTLRDCLNERADLLLLHRPLFSEFPTNLVRDNPWNDAFCSIVSAGTSVYTFGPAYDIAPAGPTDILLDVLSLAGETRVLAPVLVDRLFKIVVFTPPEAVDAVRNAMAQAGAGMIGAYSHCTFMTEGTGTFLPLPGTKPYSGEGIGKLAREHEFRLETIAPEPLLEGVVQAMIDAHPYEEVAYDLYPLANEGTLYGYGRIVGLEEPTTPAKLSDLVRQRLGLEARVTGDDDRPIASLAVYAGPGADLTTAAAEAGADAWLSGDLGLSGTEDADRLGLAAIDLPAEELLIPGIEALYERLKQSLAGQDVEVVLLD